MYILLRMCDIRVPCLPPYSYGSVMMIMSPPPPPMPTLSHFPKVRTSFIKPLFSSMLMLPFIVLASLLRDIEQVHTWLCWKLSTSSRAARSDRRLWLPYAISIGINGIQHGLSFPCVIHLQRHLAVSSNRSIRSSRLIHLQHA